MAKAMAEPDEQREQRLARIVGSSPDEYERISCWYGYLEEQIQFPFRARVSVKTAGSPLRMHEEVEVIDLSDVDDWEDQARVTLGGNKYGVDVPLAQLEPLDTTDAATRQAVADWHYWVARGYHFWTEEDE